ncbi:hypothetical protein LXL04_036057 [Taraxacum kok-saghyz]
MASVPQPPVTFSGSLSSGTSASDLLRSSSNGINGIPLRTLGRGHVNAGRKSLSITAKVRKVKKHDYPWPQDPDPNVKGGVLSHLSSFKPLKEKPKPVTLEFEKPLMDLQKKIIDVQKMANETGLDFSDQIISLENKYQQALKDLYTHLTPIQRVSIARHPNRPTFLDHVFNITDKFVELHGDRGGYDDPAIVTGIGTIDGRRFMFIGQQKGRNTKENIQRNFGMPTPHGYRKALRMMRYADHHGFPIVTFIDTPGAFADLKSEELGQGEAIAHNLRTMYGLKVPVVSIVIGEGGSGGALAIGCANKLLMLENAVFYVASPEACAAILWKTAKAAPKAAEKLKITATELTKLKVCDGTIPEPLGGAHADPHWTSQQIKKAVLDSMDELEKLNTEDLLKHRAAKFRDIGGFQEGFPVDPEKKVNMKQKEELNAEIEGLNEKFQQVMENPDLKKKLEGLNAEIEKLGVEGLDEDLKERMMEIKAEVEAEFLKGLEASGVHVSSRVGQTSMEIVKAKVDELNAEISQIILDVIESTPELKSKIEMLKIEVMKDKKAPSQESKDKIRELEIEVKEGVADVMSSAAVKEKYERLQAELKELSGGSDGSLIKQPSYV